MTPRRGSSRQLIEAHKGDKRSVRRSKEGRFTTSQDDVSRSLSQDRRRKAKTVAKKGKATVGTPNHPGDRVNGGEAVVYVLFNGLMGEG